MQPTLSSEFRPLKRGPQNFRWLTILSLLTALDQGEFIGPSDWDTLIGFMSRSPQRLEAGEPVSQ